MYRAIVCLFLLLPFVPLRAQVVPDSARVIPADSVQLTQPPAAQKTDTATVAAKKKPASPGQTKKLLLSASTQDLAILRKYNYRKELPDSISAVREVRELVLKLQEDAYLTASADSLLNRNDTLIAVLYVGDQFRWASLTAGNVSEAMLTRAGFRERFFREKPLRPRELVNLQERLLDYAENSGYPFASVRLDSIRLLPDRSISAKLILDPGPVIFFDSVQIMGNTKTKAKFLSRYVQIAPNQPYSQQRVKASARLIRQLPFLTSTRAPEVRFAGARARVYYFLEDKKANQLDGILGFMPNPVTKKLMLTGELNGVLRNITGTGKQIALQWRKTGTESQLLEVGYLHPNLFGSPIEFDFNFNLYKQGTTFLNLEPRFQFSYYTTRYGKVGFFTQLPSSRLLYSADTTTSSRLPDYAASNFQSYGINYTWNNLDDVFFPRKGWRVFTSGAVGTKRVRSLTAEQAENVPAKTAQIALQLHAERYSRITRASTLLVRGRWSGLFNEHLFLTDMYRLGGLSTLRGFNELEFYASRFAVATVEYRYFTGADSYLLAFFDQGYFQNRLKDQFQQDNPFGFGAGLSLSTGAGIFSFIYSVGKSDALGQILNFSQARLHFGITNRF